MPGKYSHARVLASYEYRGLIDPSSYHGPGTLSPQPEPSNPTSRSSRFSPSPSPLHSPSFPPPSPPPPSSHSSTLHLPHSRTSTPKPAASHAPNGTADIESPSALLRSSSITNSFSSHSTESSSRAASSVVTQIYAPLHSTTSLPERSSRRHSINATTPPVSSHRSKPPSNSSPQTSHTASHHSSSPRSNTTANTSITSSILKSAVLQKAIDEDEVYFGSDEESDSLSTLSPFSSSQYSIKPWEYPDFYSDQRHQFAPHYTPSLDDSRASSPSRLRGSSTDDAAPPPIARTRRVEFAPIPASKSDLPNAKRASIIHRLSSLRPALSLPLSRPRRRSLPHATAFTTGPPMSVSYTDTAPGLHPLLAQKSERLASETSDTETMEPTTRAWQASTFDISGMNEAELKKLRKKGVNPRLKAEMDAARKGKWMGPLVGNTFIG